MVGERDDEDLDRHEHEGTVAGTAESLLTFENAALPLSVIAPTGSIVMANRAMRTMLVYNFADLIGKSMHDLVVADPAELTTAWEDRVRGGERVTGEQRMRLRCGDGTQIVVRASSVLVTDGQGAVRYVVARAVPVRP